MNYCQAGKQLSQISFRIAVTIVLSFCFSRVFSTSAFPGLVDFRQPDGGLVKIRMMGDESLHWAETPDGYTLMSDSEGFLTLAMPDNKGNLMASEFRLLDNNMETPQFSRAKQTVRPHETYSAEQVSQAVLRSSAMRAPMMDNAIVQKQPVVGTRKYLVILIQTPDVKFTVAREDYRRLLNEEGYTEDGNSGSVHDFYYENSFGQLDLQCDVTSVYTASRNMAYYGNNANGDPFSLAVEALTAAAADYDLTDYDTDGDGYIDGVHIVFAGHGEEAGGGDNCIWSHQASTTGYFCIADGVKMNKYSCSPELRGSTGSAMSYIGVICHEIGHALGTMDFYDTNYSTGGQYQGTGAWDLMASGNWNNNGATPAHFNPYSKVYDFGWSEIKDGNKASAFSLKAKTKGHFVRIDTKTDGEFFILENRQKTGFDASIPGHGLMVYRVSGNLSRMQANTMNAFHTQQFYPMCANTTERLPNSDSNSYGIVNSASAPYPGTLGKTQLTDSSFPSMMSLDGTATGLPLTDISESSKTVSFNVAGGAGSVYGFRYDNLSPSGADLSWSNTDGKSILVVLNTDDVFGNPGSGNHVADELLDGGGTVVYSGAGSSVSLASLEKGTSYYARLYSRTNSSDSWDNPLELSFKTPNDIVTSYPYFEDFESGILESGWTQEYVEGNNAWDVCKVLNTNDYELHFDWTSGKGDRQTTRIIAPIFNLQDANRAILEFDFRNMLIGMSVYYRNSQTGNWTELATLDNHYRNGLTMSDAVNAKQHCTIALPNLSSTYQIAFEADFKWRGSSKSSLEIGTIDNVKVSVGFDAFVETKLPSFISNTWADVGYLCVAGTGNIETCGVEWSTNQSAWTKVAAPVSGTTIRLTGLTKATTIYYRAYATTAAGTYTGNIKSFKTGNFSNGSGTEADPFVISSSADWNELSKSLANSDQTGVFFVLGASFSMTPSKITNQFNGHLDGQSYTITISANNGSSLFETLGPDCVFENVNITCQTFSTKEHRNSLICIYNNGLISNCNLRVNSLKLVSSANFGGACSDNSGVIKGCSSYINMPLSQIYNYGQSGSFANQATVGGFCWYNSGIIDSSSFTGSMAANNNSKLGGIAANNWYASDQIRGIITNCINYGNLEMALVNSKAWGISIGGIAGTNYGEIEGCVNEGTMTASCTSTDCMAGGISGWNCNGSSMKYCINRGNVNVTVSTSGSGRIGGVTGFNDSAETGYCASTGTITVSGTRHSAINAVVGSRRTDTMHDCYYSCSLTDGNAQKTSDWSQTVSTVNAIAGQDYWTVSSSLPYLAWEKGGQTYTVSLKDIEYFNSTSISARFTNSINITECGILYRKTGNDIWTKMEADALKMSHQIDIKGLDPVTMYELKAYVKGADGITRYSDTKSIMTAFPYSGLADDPILITSVQDFRNFACLTRQGMSMTGKIVKLTSNLDMKADEDQIWTDFVEEFNGEFDGCGHYIYNLNVEDTGYSFGHGLFRSGSSYIHDLHVYDARYLCEINYDEVFYFGPIAGICNRIERCSYVGSVDFKFNMSGWNTWCSAGGLIGCGSAVDSYNLISLTTNWNYSFGAIAGRGSAKGCYSGKFLTDSSSGLTKGAVGNSQDASADSCYVISTLLKSGYINGTSVTAQAMRDGTLLGYLKNGIWTDNIGTHLLDGGCPVLKSQTLFPEFVTPGQDDPEEDDPDQDPVPDTDYSNMPYAVYIERLEAFPGYELSIPLSIKNDSSIVGFQFDLELPQGVDVILDEYDEPLVERGSRINPKASLSAVKTGSTVRILNYSTSNYEISGRDGVILTLETALQEDLTEGEYPVYVRNIIINRLGNIKVTVPDMKSTLSVIECIPGDANNDHSVDVVDIGVVASYILGFNPAPFNVKAADINRDNSIDVVDIGCIASYILYGRLPSQMQDVHAPSILGVADAVENTAGLTMLRIDMDKTNMNVCGGQFDIVLPQGYEFLDIEGCSDGFQTMAALQPDGTVRVITYSNMVEKGNLSGKHVARLALRHDDRTVASAQNVTIKNTVLAGYDGFGLYKVISADNTTGIEMTKTPFEVDGAFNAAGIRVDGNRSGMIIWQGTKTYNR